MMDVRFAEFGDVEAVLTIYNQGIEDRVTTLELESKDTVYMTDWFHGRTGRNRAFVAETDGEVVEWTSLHPYSHRCAYAGVGEISVYI